MKAFVFVCVLMAPLTCSWAEPFRVAAIKVMPVVSDNAGNFAKFERLTRQAVAAGAQLIVTPETYLDGYVGNPKTEIGIARKDVPRHAEPIDGPWMKKVAALARELKVYILFGFSELRDAKAYNTIAVFSPDGSLLGRYSKSHLAGGEWYEPGNELPVFDTKLGKMGILICHDRKPPETARTLALKGAQFIVVPSYNKKSTRNDEDVLMCARSQENSIFAFYVSPYNAFVSDPEGEIIAQARSEPDGLLIADIALDDQIHERLRIRRPSMYIGGTPEDSTKAR